MKTCLVCGKSYKRIQTSNSDNGRGKFYCSRKCRNIKQPPPSFKGWKHTEKTKQEIQKKLTRWKGIRRSPNTEFKKGNIKELAPNWQGGKSFEPYTTDWTITLKKSIRQRDKYTCQICWKEPAVHCHHIDYDKKNCSLDNLITLCGKCHAKTNTNRKYWIKYFKSLVVA